MQRPIRILGIDRGIYCHHRHRVQRLQIEHNDILPYAPRRLKYSRAFKLFARIVSLRREDKETMGLAYVQAHATVDMLWTRYGRGKMIMLLEAVGRGQSAEEALRDIYRKTSTSIEKDVANAYG